MRIINLEFDEDSMWGQSVVFGDFKILTIGWLIGVISAKKLIILNFTMYYFFKCSFALYFCWLFYKRAYRLVINAG